MASQTLRKRKEVDAILLQANTASLNTRLLTHYLRQNTDGEYRSQSENGVLNRTLVDLVKGNKCVHLVNSISLFVNFNTL